ncbi:MAG TPA: cytochrome P450 [Casimicrobiaceae bacterium]|nr:cytochrome P450 [Casimicrobiaceae bacterium]
MSRLPDASLAAPALVLSADDSLSGVIPRLQAAAFAAHGAVLRSNVPFGADAGPCIVLVGPAAAEAALLSRRAQFSSEQGWRHVLGVGCGMAVLNTDDPLHAEQRRIWSPAFAGAMLRSYEPAMARIVEDCIRAWRDETELDLYPPIRAFAFRAVAATIGGLPETAIGPAYHAICTILDGQDYGREPRDAYIERAAAARAVLADSLRTAIRERRRRRPAAPESLLDVLLAEPGLGGDDAQIQSHLTILLIAGHETGATLYSRALYVLAQMPPLAAALAAELGNGSSARAQPLAAERLDRLPQLDRFMLEVGRLYPPLVNLPRVAASPIEFSGYSISPGTRIAVAVAATHLLPDNYPDPSRFDIDRYACADSASRTRPSVLLTFAGGARLCMGMRFAQMEFKAIVARVLQTMTLSAAGGDVAHAGFWNARPAGPMRVRLRAR